MKASSADNPIRPVAAQASIFLRVRVAQSFIARARGLIGRPPPAPGHGLLLPGVAMVHGFGMRYRIDVLFLDDQGVIVKRSSLTPRAIRWCARARHVVELRSGESSRLGLAVGMCIRPVTVDDIFPDAAAVDGAPGADAAAWGPPAAGAQTPGVPAAGAPAEDFREGTIVAKSLGAASRRVRLRSAVLTRVAAVLVSCSDADSFAAESAVAREIGSAASAVMPPALGLTRPLADETLKRLEDEAETLYRAEGRPLRDDAELIGLYETLAQLRPDRGSHAWLRIGNVHQRSGSVGAAMDAYRRALSVGAASAGASQSGGAIGSGAGGVEAASAVANAPGDAATLSTQRKALLNLAGLALDQARQSLRRLESLAHRPGDGARNEAGGSTSAHASAAAAVAKGGALYDDYQGQLRTLDRYLMRHRERGSDPIAPGSLAQTGPIAVGAAPLSGHVDRYTASARRNAVKSARGSLHLDPADAMPARQVGRAARRRSPESLPRIEYLLGDPRRSAQGMDARDSAQGKGGRD